MKNKILYISLLLMTILPFASAAHYVVGFVNNASDGTSPNGYVITMWNPAVGMSDVVTDVIGANGNSHTNNIYMLDCELLNNGCAIGVNISVQVLNNGNGYETNKVTQAMGGYGYNMFANLTLSKVVAKSEIELLTERVNVLEQKVNALEQNQAAQDQRISTLEAWKNSVVTTITDTLSRLTSIEGRVKTLENKPVAVTAAVAVNTTPNYLNYLSYKKRSDIICGYMKDSKLKSFSDLKVLCTINTKNVCSCKEI
jgi:hypothetical protein